MPLLLQQAQPKLLITGATGCIGGAWLEQLLRRLSPAQILVLVRRPEDARLLPDNVSTCVGDLRLCSLGLEEHVIRSVCESVEEIIHCAADVRFSISLEESRTSNVIGTCNVLNLARQSKRLTKFAHVSTVYVVGDRSGDCFEEPIDAAEFLNPYEQSKCEAERKVLDAMSAIPAAIYRLSTAIGESSTGYVRNMNYFHQTLRLALRSPLPAIPGLPLAPIDLIATDWAAAALDYLVDRRFAAGSIFHVCSGPLNSMTAEELVQMTFDTFDKHRQRTDEPPVRRPQLISLERFERTASQYLTTGTLDKLWRAAKPFFAHMALSQKFQTTNCDAALAASGLERPKIRDCYRKMIDYLLASEWGARPLPNADQISDTGLRVPR